MRTTGNQSDKHKIGQRYTPKHTRLQGTRGQSAKRAAPLLPMGQKRHLGQLPYKKILPLAHKSPATRAARVLALASLCGLAACADPARLEDFNAFADAGRAYHASLSPLLDAAYLSQVERSSEDLIVLRSTNASTNDRADALAQYDAALAKYREALALIREQSEALDAYFAALASLAAPEAGQNLVDAARASAGNLSRISSRVSSFTLAGQSLDTLTNITSVAVVGHFRQKALEDALRDTAAPVARALAQHRALLNLLDDSFRFAQEEARRTDKLRTVDRPYVLDGPLPADWASARLRALAPTPTNNTIEAAKGLLRDLERAFAALTETGQAGQSLARIEGRLSQISTILNQLDPLPARAPTRR